MRIAVLGSGSKGNAYLVIQGETLILVDAGFSHRRLTHRMLEIGCQFEDLAAIFITHEHGDHVSSLRTIQKRRPIPTYASPGTVKALEASGLGHPTLQSIQGPMAINGLRVTPFSVPHDAAEPVGFRIEGDKGASIGIATDMGTMPASVLHSLRGVTTLILESNHDEEMLIQGPYPWDVKQRIRSRHGHLSNQQVREFLPELIHSRLTSLVLAHLSEHNNLPEMADLSAREVLKTEGATHVKMEVAAQHSITYPLEV